MDTARTHRSKYYYVVKELSDGQLWIMGKFREGPDLPIPGRWFLGFDLPRGTTLRGRIGPAEIGGISSDRWEFRAFGAMSPTLIGLALASALVVHLWPQRAARLIAAYVLVVTQFSYDRTCAVRSEDRLVARLQDRKEMKVSLVSIADVRIWHDIRFTTGTCDQAIEPQM